MVFSLPEAIARSPFFRSLRQSRSSIPVRSGYLNSASINFINPRHHVISTDRTTQDFPASAVEGLSDENVLALFTRGFFGGFVFGFERIFLQLGGYRMLPAHYTDFQPSPNAVTIWDKSALSASHLLPVGSNLFGFFQMLDKQVSINPSEDDVSYVDYGFGSDEFIFAGCHRFQITRLTTRPGTEPQIQMELQSFHCNPQHNKPSIPYSGLRRFHNAYAKALFANGVQSLISR